MNKIVIAFAIIVSVTMHAAHSMAQGVTFKLSTEDGVGPKIRDLNLLNNTFLMKQRSRVDALTRSNFGRPIRQNLSDLIALQRVIDNNLIERDDKELLQALGVVLGDIYTVENKNLEWKVYDDGYATHAVCLKNTEHCLFPITMLSRRIEAGVAPNARDIYHKGLAMMKPYLPKKPFMNSVKVN